MRKASIILPSLVLDEETLISLEQHFATLEKHTPRKLYQLVVVDNGSKFGSHLMRTKSDVYIRKEEKLGYAKAVNLGATWASEDVIVVTNNDIYFKHDGWLERMLETLEKYPGIVMPSNLSERQDSYRFNDTWMSLWAMTKEIWEEVEGFDDETLNWRFHDQELNIKIKMAGYNVTRDNNIAVDFINSLTYNKLGKHMEESSERNIMLSRYGHDMFTSWYAKEGHKYEKN